MLRLRICPNCQEETYSQKAYFCHRCGAELPPPPEVDLPSARGGSEADKRLEVAPQVKEKPVKKRVPSVIVVAALVAALFSAVAVGVYYLYIYRQPSPSSRPQAPKNEAFVADVSFKVLNHPFSSKGLSETVPADVDLYLESIDPEILLPSLMSAEDWAEVRSVFSEKVGLSAVEFASFLEDEFAVIQEATASAFLAKARDVDFLEQKIAEVGEYEGWRAGMVNGFLVISNSSDLIRSIGEAQKKLTLNLSLTSGFAEARKKLPQAGQIFYYGKKRLPFIPDSMKGDAFVISKKEEGVLVTGL